MDVDASFGAWLRRRRRVIDLTQEELAQRVGCSLATIRKIEVDERRPSRQMADLLADVLKIAPDEREAFIKSARGEQRVERLGEAARLPVVEDAPPPVSSLPAPPTPLIGREPELTEIGRLLNDPQCRLLALVGPGGIGKTRLAIEAAYDQRTAFDDGVYFVSFAPVGSTALIVPAISAALGLAFYGANNPRTLLINYLSSKAALLVLDNLEHLLEGVDVFTDILQQAPDVKLLVTSREQLNLQGEWTFDVQGLPVPENDRGELETNSAAALFVQRARQANADFELAAQERAAVVRICQLVEGLPLAIELAAVWVRTLTCDEIAHEIERNLDFLAVSARDMPARHRSLRAAFDHSWHLLSEDERRVLRRLSVFRGGCQREAAEQVTGATLGLLSALVAKSLAYRAAASASRHAPPRPGRYVMHELVRQYAETQLQADPLEREQTHARHADYYAALLEAWEEPLLSPRQTEILLTMDAEVDNLYQAWEWMLAHRQWANVQKSMRSLALFHEIRGRFQEGKVLFERAVTALRASPDDLQQSVALGQALARQGCFCTLLSEYPLARAVLEESITRLEAGGDRSTLADALFYLGNVAWSVGELVPGREPIQDSLALYRALGNRGGAAACLVQLSDDCFARGEEREGDQMLTEAFELMKAAGDPFHLATGLREVGGRAGAQGRYAEAQQLLAESLEIGRSLNHRWSVAETLRTLGFVLYQAGEYERAAATLRQCIILFRETGESFSESLALASLGRTTLALGDCPEAEHYFREALQVALEKRAWPMVLLALFGIATVRAQEGDGQAAFELSIHVLAHPATRDIERERARQLRLELEAKLTRQQIEAAQTRAQAQSFESVLAAIQSTSRR